MNAALIGRRQRAPVRAEYVASGAATVAFTVTSTPTPIFDIGNGYGQVGTKTLSQSVAAGAYDVLCWVNNPTVISIASTPLRRLELSEPALTNLTVAATNITTLDASNNRAITNISCHANPMLRQITLSRCKKLGVLVCYSTGITALDLSNNPLLSVLYCYSTGITALDLSENINLNTLYCGPSNLTALDVLGKTKIVTLECPSCQFDQAAVDQIVNDFYANWITGVMPGGSVNIGGTNPNPSGVYQNPPGGTPASPLEKIYVMANDPGGLGYPKYTWTY